MRDHADGAPETGAEAHAHAHGRAAVEEDKITRVHLGPPPVLLEQCAAAADADDLQCPRVAVRDVGQLPPPRLGPPDRSRPRTSLSSPHGVRRRGRAGRGRSGEASAGLRQPSPRRPRDRPPRPRLPASRLGLSSRQQGPRPAARQRRRPVRRSPARKSHQLGDGALVLLDDFTGIPSGTGAAPARAATQRAAHEHHRGSNRHPVRLGSKDMDQAEGTRDHRGRSRSTRVPCSRASSWSQSGTTGSTRSCAADVTAIHRRARWPVRPCPGPAGCHRPVPRRSRPAWSRAARPARPRRRRARRSSSRSATWCC